MNNFWIKNGRFTVQAVVIMILLPLVIGLLCLCLGRMNVPVKDVVSSIAAIFTGDSDNAQNYSIVVNLRLPRVIMAIIVGAGLWEPYSP